MGLYWGYVGAILGVNWGSCRVILVLYCGNHSIEEIVSQNGHLGNRSAPVPDVHANEFNSLECFFQQLDGTFYLEGQGDSASR